MPSLILDDFFGDIKIELQLSGIKDIDVKNSDMVNQVFCKMKSMEEKIKKYEKKWKMFNVEQHIDIVKLEARYGSENVRNSLEENESLKKEIKKVTSHRDRLLRFHKRDTKKIEDMKEDWEVATEKIANENADMRNQIKVLKKEIKEYEIESRESIVANQKVYGEAFAIQAERDRLKKENEALKERNGKKTKNPENE